MHDDQEKTAEAMEQAWDYLWRDMFCETTNLFYDYRTGEGGERFAHLPYPAEIAAQFPNPCGWGTGMEDSMLISGSVVEVLALRHRLLGDPSAAARAEKVIAGIHLCSHIHGRSGYLVRSVSPRDGRSCYINTSRDQLTLAVYGAWRFLKAFPAASPAARAMAREVLVDIASYCEKTLSPDNGFNLLRLDGRPGDPDICSMWGENARAHETMRLPMIYAAAWDITGDPHWEGLYRRYAEPGIELNLRPDPHHWWWDIEFSQMQLSLRLVYEVEPEGALRSRVREALHMGSRLAEKEFREKLAAARAFSGDWNAPRKNWRRGMMLLRPGVGGDSALFQGYPYVMPQQAPESDAPVNIMRALGNDLYAMLMDGDYRLPAELADGFAEAVRRPDYARAAVPAPVSVLHGYWVWRARG